jgi:Putative prokaryotic signal transducing protein
MRRPESRGKFGESGRSPLMKQLIETNDPVLLTWIEALLRDSGIESFVFDPYVAQLGIPLILHRIMVADDDLIRAQRLLDDAKIEYEKK